MRRQSVATRLSGGAQRLGGRPLAPRCKDSPDRPVDDRVVWSGAGRQALIKSQGMRPKRRIGSDRRAKYRACYIGSNARPLPPKPLLVSESQLGHASLADASAPVGRGNPCTFKRYEPGAVK